MVSDTTSTTKKTTRPNVSAGIDLEALSGSLPSNLDAYFMPFTANRQYKANPRVLARAAGMFYEDFDGRPILDGTAGLWCVNAGHGRREVTEAVAGQLARLDYAPPFQMGHPLAFHLADRVTGMAPEGLDHIFFTNSGSESVDTAMKIALAWHRSRGEGQRQRFISREKAYHGVNFGGYSLAGIPPNRKQFGLGLAGVDHLPHTLDLGRNAFSRGLPEHGAEKADALENLVQFHGTDNIAAVIVEPVVGSAGVIPPPKGYLKKIRDICDKYGILLIFDEVITGFGRVGDAFASQTFGVTPDLITCAKGLSNGVVPMGAVLMHSKVFEGLMQGPENLFELFHGYTYSAHPTACAAALATLDIYQREGLFERSRAMAPVWEDALHSLRGTENVIDVRNFGLMGAVELTPREGKPGTRAYDVFRHCFHKEKVLVRQAAEAIALSPPLIVEETHIEQIVDALKKAITTVK
jgi:beta-alanine--pyruvate transaminase